MIKNKIKKLVTAIKKASAKVWDKKHYSFYVCVAFTWFHLFRIGFSRYFSVEGMFEVIGKYPFILILSVPSFIWWCEHRGNKNEN